MLGNLTATPGWEDLFDQRIMDSGFRQFIGHPFYASKDNIYPTLSGGRRRINWGWANVGDGSAQSLPREITFNALTHTLEQERPIAAGSLCVAATALLAMRGRVPHRPALSTRAAS